MKKANYGQNLIALMIDLMYWWGFHLQTDQETGDKIYRVVRHGRVENGKKDLILVEAKTPEAALAALEGVLYRDTQTAMYMKTDSLRPQIEAEEEMVRLIKTLII